MRRFFNRSAGIAEGKIKKFMSAAALMICCVLPLTLTASAVGNEVKLEANGNEASLEVYFPQAAAEAIASMQISLSVTANSENVDLEFTPDSGLSSKIVESRYQSETGTLNIYLAGTESLFSSSGYTKVGVIKINSDTNSSAAATVGVVKDSVKFVRSGELVSPDSSADYPAPVTITSGQSSSGTQNPSYPNYPNYPTENYFPNISVSTGGNNGRNDNDSNDKDETQRSVRDDSDDISDNDGIDDVLLEEQDTVGENLNPPDTSELLDAVSKADGYREKDYTENSYKDLKDAVDKANDVISDPNSTQDDIDDALLDIQNAIGMLKPQNDIPSGAEGYGGNNGSGADAGDRGSLFGDDIVSVDEDNEYVQDGQSSDGNGTGHDGNGNAVQTEQNGDIVNASDGSQPINSDPFSGNEESGKSPVMLIAIIAAAVVIAAAAALIVLKKVNGKKAAEVNRFKN